MNNEPTIASVPKVMLWLIAGVLGTILMAAWLCGCASHATTPAALPAATPAIAPTPPMPPTPSATVSGLISVVQKSLITPSTNPPPSIELTWTENYMPQFTNEQTAIEETTDFVTWATVFTGATNECWVQEDSPYGFFRAYNFLP
jgi:hypothetical protein